MAMVLKMETLKNYPKRTWDTVSGSLGQKQLILPSARVEETGNSWTKSSSAHKGHGDTPVSACLHTPVLPLCLCLNFSIFIKTRATCG